MRYYLSTYIGSGTDEDPYRPSGVDGVAAWSSIDLRPPGAAEGRCLLAVPEPLTGSVARFSLGDDLDDISPGVRHGLQNRLGIDTDARAPLRVTIFDILFRHGNDARPDRWNQLKPEADGWHRVYLGGLIHAQPRMVASTISDNFTRANNNDMSVGAPFPWTDVTGDFGISGNLARNVTNNVVRARAESDLATSNHYCQTGLILGTSALTDGGVCARYSSSADTCYMARRTRDAGGTSRITKVISGTTTVLATGTSAAGGDFVNVTTRLECNGSTISATYAGASLLQVTDTSIVAGTRAGIGSHVAGGAGRVIHASFIAEDVTPNDTSQMLLMFP